MLKRIILILFLFSSFYLAQIKSNLELFIIASDSLGSILNEKFSASSFSLSVYAPENLIFLKNNFYSYFSSKGKLNPSSQKELIIVVDKVEVIYSDIEKTGFFGSYYTNRTIKLECNFTYKGDEIINDKVAINFTDKIEAGEIDKVENPNYSFTQGKKPNEPLLLSLTEPLIIIGAGAAAVILFFTVRSK